MVVLDFLVVFFNMVVVRGGWIFLFFCKFVIFGGGILGLVVVYYFLDKVIDLSNIIVFEFSGWVGGWM